MGALKSRARSDSFQQYLPHGQAQGYYQFGRTGCPYGSVNLGRTDGRMEAKYVGMGENEWEKGVME